MKTAIQQQMVKAERAAFGPALLANSPLFSLRSNRLHGQCPCHLDGYEDRNTHHIRGSNP